jgi:hypothetical protein
MAWVAGFTPRIFRMGPVSYFSSEAAYACLKLRADAVSSVPIRLYKKKDVSGKEELENIPQHPVLPFLKHVNPNWTFSRLMAFHEHAMCATASRSGPWKSRSGAADRNLVAAPGQG